MKKNSIFLMALILICNVLGCSGETDSKIPQPTNPAVSEPVTEPTITGADLVEPPSGTDAEDVSDDREPAREVGVFDLEKGTVLLNSGYEMPILGIGCFRLSQEEAENSVYWALRDGYRLIDTARIYGNEPGVGRGIQRAIDEGIVTREEIFVTTKMWTSDYDNGAAAIEASLDRLGLDYIDLMILHHSQPENDVEAYKAMEQAVADGKLKSIGLSNYYEKEDFDRLVNATTIVPALIQNETHPYHQSMEMKEHIAKYGTVMESWFPLGGRGNTQTLFQDETISSIAKAHDKTSAQVILRWHLQAGNIAIPGSSNEAHIKENFEIFDFELSEDEMQRITDIDKDQRFAGY
ncbi:MAG: aldo/keto reductase [Lachnospiraceae bacterium]|nr:aldo/keto reductase [Lachnospiraceae bacterium]